MGTITIKNLSTYTDYAALARVSRLMAGDEYYTKDPAKAKPWRAPNGTSGLYMKGEVCLDPQAQNPAAVYRSKKDSNEFSPSAYPANWELVNV